MDILFPCSICLETFTLRKHFLIHMESAHHSSDISDDSKSLFTCSCCDKQFISKSILKKHKFYEHNNGITVKKKRTTYDINNYLLLKDLLPKNYTYQILAFKEKLFGQFKAKFQILNIDKEMFIDWLNNLCQNSKVNYMSENNNTNHSFNNMYRKVFSCKNIDYWNIKTNRILENPTNCKATLSVVIKPLNEKLDQQTKAVILMKHCHNHPMNYFTSLKHYQTIKNVYNEFINLFKSDHSAAVALHMYKMKIIQNQGKNNYLNFIDSEVKPDVEFVYDLYYMHIGKSDFLSPLIKRIESLMTSVSYYNVMAEAENAAVNLLKNNIVVAIRTQLMKMTNTDTVLVCSTSFNTSKTWFLFGYNDKEILTPVGVIIATDDNECMLNSGLNLWKNLGGNLKTVVVEFIHMMTFQSVFPKASICVSKFHFLLDVWKWLFTVEKKNNFNDKLDCFVEFKKIVYSKDFITNHYFNKNSITFLIKKFPNFKQFIQNIYKNDILFYNSTLTTNPCSTMFERKLIYYQTKSLSIVQMFHFVIDEIDLFYENMSKDILNNQQTILNVFEKTIEDKNNFTYSCINENCYLYLIESVNGDNFFVDMDIGVCSCTINNVCAPCIHQLFLNKCLNDKSIDCVTKTCILSTSNSPDKEKLNIEKKHFERLLNEFQNVNNKIKEQFVTNPDYFKSGIQSFVSSLKNNLVSDKSLYLACHSLNNVEQIHLD